MKLDELKKYKKILILGYGKEGKATESFLKKYLPRAILGIADKSISPNYLDEQKKFDLVIKTPGIPKHLVTGRYTTATNIFLANIKNQVIGVTGSKGKSTTASLIYSILKEAGKKVRLIGNIGRPMLEVLMNKIDQEEILVVEFSSYQLDDINYSPHIAVILNLFPEHMNYHGTTEDYYGAKKNLISKLKENDYFVYNPKFLRLSEWAKNATCQAIPIQDFFIKETGSSLIGNHNKDNVSAAATVVRLFGVNDKIIKGAVKNFQPLPHRLQFVGKFKGISFYDDAISTTPESTIFAIDALKNVSTVMLGGQDRGYNFEELVKTIFESRIANVILFPDSGKKIMDLIVSSKNSKKPKLFQTRDMEKAVKFAYSNTPQGTVCLLSCASPSYSLWRNFEEKGDLFQTYVKKYSSQK